MVEFDHLMRQISKIWKAFGYPQPPVIICAVDQLSRRFLQSDGIEDFYLSVFRPGRDPVIAGSPVIGRQHHPDSDGRVYRALSNRVHAEMSVFRVPPCTLRSFVFLDSNGPLFYPGFSTVPGINQEVAIIFVMKNRLQSGFIERCIGNIVLVKIKILMEKQADLP
ncbi:MAG: hypothetical protein HND38_18180 [Planctomycetes bacterium]|nr:hypothetical protein [Planctomycetota bacterium]